MQRLSCRLKIGTNSEDLPEIQIYDYDQIAASSTVVFYIANIQTLPVTITAPISIGARLYYSQKYGIVYLYKPIDYLPAANTAFAGKVSVAGTSIVSGMMNVLNELTYAFTFSLTSAVTSTDYIVFQFPNDMFDRNIDSYADVTTDVAGTFLINETFIIYFISYIYR